MKLSPVSIKVKHCYSLGKTLYLQVIKHGIMKKRPRYLLLAISALLFIACGKDNGKDEPQNTITLNREDLIGCWKVIQAKYDEGAKMTDWAFEDTYATFEENGLYKGEGYFGNGEGTYSVSGNVITTKVDNAPYIVYEVTEISEDKSKANLIATLQSNQMKIWMVVERTEDLEIYPPTSETHEEYFSQEGQVIAYIWGLYYELSKFVEKELAIEDQLISGDFSSLDANNEDINSMWTVLCSTLRKINVALESLNNYGNGFVDNYIPHLKALRAFVAYNLSTLWGDVPYTISSSTPADELKIMKSDEILKLAAEDIGESYPTSNIGYGYSMPNTLNKWYTYLNPCAAQVLYGEIKLTQGKLDEAKSHFILGNAVKVGKEEYSMWDTVFTFLKYNDEGQTEELAIVYNKQGINLLSQEANGIIDNLADSWRDFSRYGYWQMLKRIGKAEEVTGCQKYQLLFPYPFLEAAYWIHQNPGY